MLYPERKNITKELKNSQIERDVTLGLNYLYHIKPDPIVQRDISSANVLLEALPYGKWRAKLTDYGSVNVVH